MSSPELEREVADAGPELEAMCALLGDGVEVDAKVLTSTDVARKVADYAHENDALIAMSTHGRTGLRKLVLGSVAQAVLSRARTPVICFPLKN